MKKKLTICVSLMLVLSLALNGCGIIAGEIAKRKLAKRQEEINEYVEEASKEVTESLDDVKESLKKQDFTFPEKTEEETAETVIDDKWKDEYISLLKQTRNLSGSEDENGINVLAEYWLYDIDKDGIPELLLKFGSCEADYHGFLYTFKDGRSILVEDNVGLGHTGLDSAPNQNGVILYNAHMGYAACYLMTMKDNKTDTELLFEDDINEAMQNGEDTWYKSPSTVIPGSFSLLSYSPDTDYPIREYETIEAFRSGKTKAEGASNAKYPGMDEEFYKKLMDSDTVIDTVGTDQYSKAPGYVTFKELLKPNVLESYDDSGMEVSDYCETDVNLDGIMDAVVYLKYSGAENYGTGPRRDYRVILTYTDGITFAYITNYPNEIFVDADTGSFIQDPEWNPDYQVRLLFDKHDVTQFSVPIR